MSDATFAALLIGLFAGALIATGATCWQMFTENGAWTKAYRLGWKHGIEREQFRAYRAEVRRQLVPAPGAPDGE